jgi:hypothetical protein
MKRFTYYGSLASFPYLLDLYPNAYAAYSLRKLRAAYLGSAIRVRRSSDNAEQDIGFVNNELDTTSLLSFVGAGNGFVRIFYDQSGNSLNFDQTSFTVQPQIVNSGTVITFNGKPAMYADGNRRMAIASSTSLFNFLHNGTLSFVASVQGVDNITSLRRMYGNAAASTANTGIIVFTNNLGIISTNVTRGVAGTLVVGMASPSNTLTTNQFLLSQRYDVGNGTATNRLLINVNSSVLIANNGQINAPSLANASANYHLFDDGSNTNRYLGHFQEKVIYNFDQTVNRIAIETNINSFYNIYP